MLALLEQWLGTFDGGLYVIQQLVAGHVLRVSSGDSASTLLEGKMDGKKHK